MRSLTYYHLCKRDVYVFTYVHTIVEVSRRVHQILVVVHEKGISGAVVKGDSLLTHMYLCFFFNSYASIGFQ